MYQPAFEEIRHAIRLEHPRLLISPEQIPMVRERSKGACKECFEQIRKRTDALPEHPEPEFIDDIVKYQDGKVFFVKNIGDQNAVSYGLKNTGGADAFRCALMYYVTGDKTYAVKAFQYLMLAVKFIQIADRSRILPEWFNAGRLAAIIAYDWLYDALSDEQRRAFIEPMLKHLDSMRNPGYLTNQGNYDSGNYGEPGLRWYFGLAAYQNGICDDAAEKYLLDGWNLNTAMMNFREEKSDGKGLLSSISPEYSFGMYPIATDHFLMTLQSACGFDGTKIWKQPFRFANYFNWMSIPDNTAENGFYQYGWGDTYHIENQFVCAKYIYTHLAAAVHLYGDSDEIRAVIQCLPEKFRNIIYQDEFPWLSFVLTGFDPDKKFHGDVNAVLNSRLAEHFPSYGLTVMRSGIGRNDTYASVKAGASACGHQHYDELSFNIYRSGFQALDTGIRSSTPHHKAYYPQTVAHNSLLIRMENEPIPSYWYPANAPRIDWNKVHCDGGQNAKQQGGSFGMSQSPYHVVTGGNAAACYSAEKCREAIRLFIFVKPDVFVIYDRIVSVKPDQRKVFLLHTVNKPENLPGGILKSTAGNGALFLKSVLPVHSAVELIGGPGREFWTGGQNYPLNEDGKIRAKIQQKGSVADTWLGSWRTEITFAEDKEKAVFLTVLQTADNTETSMIPVENISDEDFDGVQFTAKDGITAVIRFSRDERISAFIRLEKDGAILTNSVFSPLSDRK